MVGKFNFQQMNNLLHRKTKLSKGISVIEILVVLVIIGIITGLMLPRFQDGNSENSFKRDTSFFVENIGKAQAMATSSNSRSCANSVNEKLNRIELEIMDASQYRIVPYCESTVVSAPTPNPLYIMPFKTQATEMTPGGLFASFFPDGTVTSGVVVTFSGTQSCNISISTTGVVTNTCPQ